MPSASSFRVPFATSGNGLCKTNLRGVFVGSEGNLLPYDFVSPSRTFEVIQYVASESIQTPVSWGSLIKKTYDVTSEENSPQFSYGLFPFSTAISGTFLFRLYIKPRTTYPPLTTDPIHVFYNGVTGGYGLYLTYTSGGKGAGGYILNFTNVGQNEAVRVSHQTNFLDENTWYHFGIRFLTSGGNTRVSGFQNGVATLVSGPFPSENELDAPSGECCFFRKGLLPGYAYFGKMTDFAFLETQLTDTQIANIATTGYP